MVNLPDSSSSKLFSPFSSSLGENGFLLNRPMSSGIDSITQGFRFSVPGKKLPVMGRAGAGGGGGFLQEARNAIPSRGRADTEINGAEGESLTFPNIDCYFLTTS